MASPPQTGAALLILAAFVLPGFVALVLRERTHVIAGSPSPFERLMQALFYSALIYAIAVAIAAAAGLTKDDLAALYKGEESLWELLGAGIALGLVLPFAVAQSGLLWRKSKKLRPWLLGLLRIPLGHSMKSGWDRAFEGKGAFVRVFTKDGRVILGQFDKQSLAGYADGHQDLYLSCRWVADDDGWFASKDGTSLGVWIPKDSIAWVEMYEPRQTQGDP